MFLKNVYKSNGKMQAFCDESVLYPILPADKLLADPSRQALLNHLRTLVNASDDYYDTFYLKLIHSYVEFVQALPFTDIGPVGELLDYGLQLAVVVLQVQKENPLHSVDPLINYAIFSAFLLWNIDKVFQLKKVIISDEDGAAFKEWLPFEGSMIDKGKYYRIRSYRAVLPHEIKLVLARMLMKDEAYLWLASDNKTFRMWLAILLNQEDDEATRGVKNILSLIKERLEEIANLNQQLDPLRVDAIESVQTEAGEEFLRWLKEGLENKSISVNQEDSKVHILQEGTILTHPDLFKDFASTSKYKNWIVVQKQFNHLGLAKLSGYDRKIEQYFSETPESLAKKISSFSGAKTKTSAVTKTGVLLATEWLYTSPSSPLPAMSNKVVLSQQETLSKKRMWPKLKSEIVAPAAGIKLK